MKIESLKDLQKVIQLCRKTGVKSFKLDGIELELGDIPNKGSRKPKLGMAFPDTPTIPQYSPGGIDEQTKIVAETMAIATDELSEEDLLFYSSRPEDQAQQ